MPAIYHHWQIQLAAKSYVPFRAAATPPTGNGTINIQLRERNKAVNSWHYEKRKVRNCVTAVHALVPVLVGGHPTTSWPRR
jgi:hypothetical protein